MMAVIGRAGREGKGLCVCGGERWDRCGVGGLIGIGTGGEEMTMAGNTLPLMPAIGGILFHQPTMQNVKGATIKDKGQCKGVRVGAGRGGEAGRGIGVGGAGSTTVGGAGTAGMVVGGAVGGVRGVGGEWSSGGRGGGAGAADTVQPRTFPPHHEGPAVLAEIPKDAPPNALRVNRNGQGL